MPVMLLGFGPLYHLFLQKLTDLMAWNVEIGGNLPALQNTRFEFDCFPRELADAVTQHLRCRRPFHESWHKCVHEAIQSARNYWTGFPAAR